MNNQRYYQEDETEKMDRLVNDLGAMTEELQWLQENGGNQEDITGLMLDIQKVEIELEMESDYWWLCNELSEVCND